MANQKARELRDNLTDAERKLWTKIRRKQLEGYRFRRQHPIGPFIVDFVCLEAKLVIEVDGGQHADPEEARRDVGRTQWLRNEGYRVLRFWNNELLQNSAGVLQTILGNLRDADQ